jgi:uncharacterized protein YecE (DUF72 family)
MPLYIWRGANYEQTNNKPTCKRSQVLHDHKQKGFVFVIKKFASCTHKEASASTKECKCRIDQIEKE